FHVTGVQTCALPIYKAAAASTVYLVCRKRPDRDEEETVFFDSIEAEVREAARDAYFRLTEWGVEGVDRLLATYGPVLSVVSRYRSVERRVGSAAVSQ